MIRKGLTIALLTVAATTVHAGEPRFSLHLRATTVPRSLSPTQQAQMALWNDPMVRLMRTMDAELGHLMVGQPGGRTPPLIMAGLGGGLPPRILASAFEHSFSRAVEPPPVIQWPWSESDDTNPPPMEEELARLLGQRLERRLGGREP